jgi:hypothetical protein
MSHQFDHLTDESIEDAMGFLLHAISIVRPELSPDEQEAMVLGTIEGWLEWRSVPLLTQPQWSAAWKGKAS